MLCGPCTRAEGSDVSIDGATADLIFVNGAVYTVDAARRWAQAVAVRDGRIVGGRHGRRDPGRSPDRAPRWSTSPAGCSCRASRTPTSTRWVGASTCSSATCTISTPPRGTSRPSRPTPRRNPDVPWILGGGWAMDVFPGGTPTKEALDDVVPDRPVFLPNRDGHGAWVNSGRLKIAGVTRDTAGSRGRPHRARTRRGEPTGTLHEGAMDLVERPRAAARRPRRSHAGAAAGAGLPALARHHRRGRTRSSATTPWADNLDAYIAAARRRRPDGARGRARCGGIATAASSRSTDLLGARANADAPGGSRATSVKIMQDGVCENFTAAMLEPYLRRARARRPRTAGISFVEPELLKGRVTRLDAEGFQVHFHAIGDRAVREALDAIEAARAANGPSTSGTTSRTSRWSTPTTCRGSAQLGVVANAQPLWAAHEPQMDELTIPFLGEPRGAGSTRSRASCARARRSRSAATGRSRRPTRSGRSTWR